MNHVIVIHGGAGTILRSSMTPERESGYRAALHEALAAGDLVLARGGSAVDAVVAAVRSMEDCPLFNAGRGAVFTSDGRNELDACVMDGRTRAAGAVAGVTTIRNPVLAAQAVMTRSPHVLLIGSGAESFASQQGLDIVGQEYFRTEERWQQLLSAQARGSAELDHDGASSAGEVKFGTVGAVAFDTFGNLAAATSTGGMTNKTFGRVGDSPIPGAGNYADEVAAVSGTGTGEVFIRTVAGHEVAALMKYRSMTVQQAVDDVALRQIPEIGGRGGLIAVDAAGRIGIAFNTEGMYRGVKRGGEEAFVDIYRAPDGARVAS
jgi:beta-aspartyl-peptidase (threonine type)